jgi:hypothetical protein
MKRSADRIPITAQLARATEITTVLSGSGLGWLVQALGLRGCASP